MDSEAGDIAAARRAWAEALQLGTNGAMPGVVAKVQLACFTSERRFGASRIPHGSTRRRHFERSKDRLHLVPVA